MAETKEKKEKKEKKPKKEKPKKEKKEKKPKKDKKAKKKDENLEIEDTQVDDGGVKLELSDDAKKKLSPEQKKEEKERKKEEKKALKMEKKERKKNSKVRKLFKYLILLAVLGLTVGVLVFNINSWRDVYVRPVLEKIPVVGSLLPPITEEGALASKSRSELVKEVESLNSEIEFLNEENLKLTGEIADNNSVSQEYDDLQAREEELLTEKADLDKALADGNPDAFIQYFEEISPDNATAIYRDLKGQVISNQELKDYVAKYSAMDADACAKIFEELILTDSDLVVLILKNMNNDFAGEVIAAMTPANGATVTKLMAPKEETQQ